jgi:hypothetical protein
VGTNSGRNKQITNCTLIDLTFNSVYLSCNEHSQPTIRIDRWYVGGLDLDSLYRRQMRAPLKQAKIEWEGWHGFRRGLATNLERIGVRESIAAMILRHANDRVTRKHYIKPPTLEAVAAMRRLSESFSAIEKPTLLPTCSPESPSTAPKATLVEWVQ